MNENRFGEWLRSKRLDLGLTMMEFSKAVGVSYVTISNVELGKAIPGMYFLRKLETYLGIEYIELRRILKGEEPNGD